MLRQISLLLSIFCIAEMVSAQADTIHLRNPSFEDIPSHSQGVRGWSDCGFDNESAPDVQPFRSSTTAGWGQLEAAFDGNTYLGMVVRENDTYERISQQLSSSLERGSCYSFSVYLSSSDKYMSATSSNRKALSNYTKPTLLRIWGGNDYCDRRELLAESPTISNTDWQRFDFEFHSNGRYSFIMLEAYYKTPTLITYNGNILIDNCSPIVRTACPGEEPLAVVEKDPSEDVRLGNETPKTNSKPKSNKTDKPKAKIDEIGVAAAKLSPAPRAPKNRILKNLDRSKIVKGQTIRIENLYFEADSATVDSSSYAVLEEIAYFLSQNRDIVVEIAGHTNGRPLDDFADRLSTQRAESVSKYILSLGIDEHQVKHKGYGRRKPLASNQTRWGRERNQRVEVRILSVM